MSVGFERLNHIVRCINTSIQEFWVWYLNDVNTDAPKFWVLRITSDDTRRVHVYLILRCVNSSMKVSTPLNICWVESLNGTIRKPILCLTHYGLVTPHGDIRLGQY